MTGTNARPATTPLRPSTTIVDLHADLLWRTCEQGKDPWADCPGEMLDLPRMGRHGPTVQLFTLYTPGDRVKEAATAYADGLHAIWTDLVRRGEGRLRWIRSRADLRSTAPADLAGLLSMEGASPLRGEIALLDRYVEMGVRSLGLTHNPRNEAGDGCMVPDGERRGLTEFGRDLVRGCAARGVLLDVAHLAPEGFDDLMETWATTPERPPVVTTHTGAKAVTPHRRNLTDAQLRDLAATGGLAGVTCYPPHVARNDTGTTLEDVIAHLEHMAEVIGPEHVAVGADLDGFDPPGLPDGCDTPLVYGRTEAALLARGWTRAQVDGVLGGNALRVLERVLR